MYSLWQECADLVGRLEDRDATAFMPAMVKFEEFGRAICTAANDGDIEGAGEYSIEYVVLHRRMMAVGREATSTD